MKVRSVIFLLFAFFAIDGLAQRTYLIQGTVVDDDSTTIPFTYVINNRNGNGCVSDFNGKFSITARDRDTISFSYVGFTKKKVFVVLIKNTSDSTKQVLKIVLHKGMVNLNTFTATAFKIKPSERDYMKRVIGHQRPTGWDALNSPITALYETFSHKGKAQRKLAGIFEQIFIDEQVAQKLNPEILRRLTGDETIDFEKFKKYCYSVSDQFILNHEGYELYDAIMQCYRRWKKEGR